MEILLPLDAGKGLQASLQHAAGAPSGPLPPAPRRTQILEPPVRKYRNSAFVTGSEAKPTEAIEFIKDLLENSMETSNFCKLASIPCGFLVSLIFF